MAGPAASTPPLLPRKGKIGANWAIEGGKGEGEEREGPDLPLDTRGDVSLSKPGPKAEISEGGS